MSNIRGMHHPAHVGAVDACMPVWLRIIDDTITMRLNHKNISPPHLWDR